MGLPWPSTRTQHTTHDPSSGHPQRTTSLHAQRASGVRGMRCGDADILAPVEQQSSTPGKQTPYAEAQARTEPATTELAKPTNARVLMLLPRGTARRMASNAVVRSLSAVAALLLAISLICSILIDRSVADAMATAIDRRHTPSSQLATSVFPSELALLPSAWGLTLGC